MKENPKANSLPIPGIKWRGLTVQLFGFVVIPLIGLLLIVSFLSQNLHQEAMRDLVAERDERAARSAAQAINERLHHRIAAIQGLGLRVAEDEDLIEIIASSDYLRDDFDAGMGFFSREGDMLSASEFSIFQEISSGGLPEGLLESNGAPVISSPIEISGGEYIVYLAFAVGLDDPVAVGAFYPSNMARDILASSIIANTQSSVILTDSEFHILYNSNFDLENIDSHFGVLSALRGESGASYSSFSGEESVVAFSTIPLTSWALVIEEPWENVASTFLNSTQAAPLILAPILVLTLVALWFGARQIVQPLQKLSLQASALSWGDFDALKEQVGGIDEIQSLQRELVHLAIKVQSSQKSLKSYIGAITLGQEEERKRLARDLHDDTIQSMIALNQRMHLLIQDAEKTKQKTAILEVQELVEETIDNLRRTIRVLRPLYLESLGLVASLQQMVKEVNDSSECEIEFQVEGNEQRFSAEKEIAIYRIAQEGLSNIAKHSQAKHALLTFRFQEGIVTLGIQDDGVGFDIPDTPTMFATEGHYGLLGIFERAELMGAKVELESSKENGTILTMIFSDND